MSLDKYGRVPRRVTEEGKQQLSWHPSWDTPDSFDEELLGIQILNLHSGRSGNLAYLVPNEDVLLYLKNYFQIPDLFSADMMNIITEIANLHHVKRKMKLSNNKLVLDREELNFSENVLQQGSYWETNDQTGANLLVKGNTVTVVNKNLAPQKVSIEILRAEKSPNTKTWYYEINGVLLTPSIREKLENYNSK